MYIHLTMTQMEQLTKEFTNLSKQTFDTNDIQIFEGCILDFDGDMQKSQNDSAKILVQPVTKPFTLGH